MKRIVLGLVILSALGCVGRSPIRDIDRTELDFPARSRIARVPLYRQAALECGPATLRMVLNFYGLKLSNDEVRKARRGELTSIFAMESYVKSVGFGFYRFYDRRKEKMKFFLSRGYPLIALGVRPSNWAVGRMYNEDGHYVVVVGYDEARRIFHVIDPDGGRMREIPYPVFGDFHASHPFEPDYVLCIYPK